MNKNILENTEATKVGVWARYEQRPIREYWCHQVGTKGMDEQGIPWENWGHTSQYLGQRRARAFKYIHKKGVYGREE